MNSKCKENGKEEKKKPRKRKGKIINKLEKEIVYRNIINEKETLIENAKKLLEEKV